MHVLQLLQKLTGNVEEAAQKLADMRRNMQHA